MYRNARDLLTDDDPVNELLELQAETETVTC
jgi:hypothetical protein